MNNVLLSIDWDYFIPIKREWCESYLESNKNVQAIWYKRYFKYNNIGIDIANEVKVGKIIDGFWEKINRIFNIRKDAKVYVTDSHKWSYRIAKENDCKYVFNIDAHSDLGYEGIKSLMFEVNCSNWLGKLLGDNIIKNASIIYSPYTYENKEAFNEINNEFHVNYCKLANIESCNNVYSIHVCRSGMWTPPWLDKYFFDFVGASKRKIVKENCSLRQWKPKDINLSERLDYLYCC
ncbi:arginase [Clostridium acetobutylicum]|nr:arginase [Clostridium acetobutylicum]